MSNHLNSQNHGGLMADLLNREITRHQEKLYVFAQKNR